MKNTMTITKKESRHLQLNEITMSKPQFINFIKDELLKFYTDKLTYIDSYPKLEKEKLFNIIQEISNGKYNQKISDNIPKEFPFNETFNGQVIIEDNLAGCGNLEVNIDLIPSWVASFREVLEI